MAGGSGLLLLPGLLKVSDDEREKDRRERRRGGDKVGEGEGGGRSLCIETPSRSFVPLTSSVSIAVTDQACDSVRGDNTGYDSRRRDPWRPS